MTEGAAETLGVDQGTAEAFLAGNLQPKRMPVEMLRLELELRGYSEEAEGCATASEMRSLLQTARANEQADEARRLKEVKFATADDKAVLDQISAWEKDGYMPGDVAEGQLPRPDELSTELLLEELALRAPSVHAALLADEAKYSEKELRYELMAAREVKGLSNETALALEALGTAKKDLREMGVTELKAELEARGALPLGVVLIHDDVVAAVRTERQGSGMLDATAAQEMREKQLEFIYERKAGVWGAISELALDILPEQQEILADIWEEKLKASGMLRGDRSLADMTPDDPLDTEVPLTLRQAQKAEFDPRTNIALNDPIVKKAMDLIQRGNAEEAMKLLEREPNAMRAFNDFAGALMDAGVEL